MEIDARVHGNAVLIGAAVRECVDRSDRDAVGIQIAELRPLLEGHAAAIPGCARRDVVVRDKPGRLSGQSVVVLLVERVGDDAGALLDRLALFESLRDAAPVRKRLGGGIAGGRESFVTRGSKRGNVGGAEIVERFVERLLVDVAVGRVRADVAEIGVSGERQVAGGVVPQTQVKRRRAVPRDVGNAVDARIVLREKARILQAIAGQPVVGVTKAERSGSLAVWSSPAFRNTCRTSEGEN